MKTRFIIMPIGAGEKDNIFENIIRPAVEEFKFQGNQIYDCIRADSRNQSGSIIHLILNNIYKSDVVIADLSELNPNVLYELGNIGFGALIFGSALAEGRLNWFHLIVGALFWFLMFCVYVFLTKPRGKK